MRYAVSRVLTLAMLASLLLAAPSVPAQEAEAPAGFDSPEAVYAAARDAFNARDWSAFVDCVSPARREEIIGQMAVALASMAQQPGSDPRIGELVDEYLPRDVDPMSIMMADDAQKQTILLAKRMGDAEGFFVDAMSLIFAMQYTPAELAPAEAPEDEPTEGGAETEASEENAPQPLDAEVTELNELTIEDGVAEGRVTIVTSTGEQRDRWAFEKYEGRWYLSMN